MKEISNIINLMFNTNIQTIPKKQNDDEFYRQKYIQKKAFLQ